MTIFERLKQKAQQALTGVGNFIDRDKSMGGVQLQQGGLINNARNFVGDARQRAKDRNQQIYNNIANTQVGGHRLEDQVRAYPQAFMENLPFTPDRQENLNRNIEDILGEKTKATTVAQGLNNWVGAPLAQVPYNTREAFGGEEKSGLSRVGHGAQALFGLLPGVDDALFAGYNSLKGAATERDLAGAQPGLAGNEYYGLGDAVTGGNKDSLITPALNMAELPLLLFGGLKAKNLDEVLQNQMKNADNLSGLKRVNGADELVTALPKRAKDTIYVTPSGSAIKPKVQPKTTASLDSILRQADDVIPGGTKQSDELGGLLTAGNPDVPQLPAKAESVINTQKQGDSFFKSLRKSKDVSTFDKIRLDRQSRLEKALPPNVYSKIKTNIVDPKNKLIADSIDWGRKYEDALSSSPIKMGSKEDKLIKQLNSGSLNEKQLVEQVGEVKAKQIIDTHTQLRGMYEEMINFVNPRRVEAGLTPIPYKQDFLSQVGNKRSGNMIEDLFFGKDKTTGAKSQTIFKRQGATNEDFGAIEGMAGYLDYIKRAGFTDLVTPKLDEYINLAGKAGADPSVVKYLENYRNEILGVRDSGLGDQIASITGNVRGAAVLGNARSFVAQTFNLPQAMAESNPKNFIKGMFSKGARVAEKESPLLKSLSDSTPTNLTKGLDKIKKPAADALQAANNVTARQVWRSFFEQGKSKGVDDAIQYADDLTVQIMGDRRLGELGEYYQSWFGKTFSPFTLENQAAMNKLFKSVGEKKVGTVLGTLAAWRISNDLNEKFGTGDRPFLDPADMLNDTYQQWYGTDEKEPDKVKAVARVFTELTRLVPALQSPFFTGAKLALGDKTRDIFGTNDPTWMNALSLYDITDVGRNITGNKAVDVPWNLASKVLPYANQAARSTQALVSQGRGYTESRKGNPMFETPSNPFDIARSIFFGQNSTQEARDMFDNEFDWGLNTSQGEIMDKIPTRDGKIEYLNNAKKSNISDKKLDSILEGGKTNADTSLFDSKSATSGSVKERMDTFKELNKILSDENIPQSAKNEFIKASGADPKDAAYYTMAAQDMDVKLQDEILPKLETMDDKDLMDYLGSQRRVVGGKQMLTSGMIDYLYDRDYISKAQSKALKAIKYDEIKNEFYYKGGSGGGTMSYAQAKKAFQLDLPKFSKLKSLDLMFEPISGGASQTARDGNKLLSDILSGKPQRGGNSTNKKLWFNQA